MIRALCRLGIPEITATTGQIGFRLIEPSSISSRKLRSDDGCGAGNSLPQLVGLRIEPKLRRCADRLGEPKRRIGRNGSLFPGDVVQDREMARAPRPMKTGTIASPWHYDGAAYHTLPAATMRPRPILPSALLGERVDLTSV